jgi:hypothetical protein
VKAVGNFVALALVILLLATINASFIAIPFQLAWTLCLGWAFAAARLATRLQEHTTGLLTWAILFLIVGLIAQRFCKAIAAHRDIHWRARWTIAGLGGLWLSLFAAMAIIGVAHQIGWIVVSGEPWTSRNEAHTLVIAAMLVSNAAQDGRWTTNEIRRAVPIEMADLVLQRDVINNDITNVVVIHRDGRTGFIEVRRDGRLTRRPMNELNDALGLTAAK